MPKERIDKCLRSVVPGRSCVDIVYSQQTQSAHYKNLVTCGSVWMCSVCAARITEQRAADLQAAVTKWHTEGGFCAMVTYTLRHSRDDRLETVLEALRGAHRRFKAGRSWYQYKDAFNWHGSVTALEVTHGTNGWHPHLHELVFCDPIAAHKWREFPDASKERWAASLASEGRDATWDHGLTVKDANQDVYDYIAKYGHEPIETHWTIDREIAKAPVKKAREGGRTPFQMLLDYGDGDTQAGALFIEYATTFKGRAQLFWSRGLRDELALGDERPDDELAAALPESYVTLASLTVLQWRKVLMLNVDIRAEILIAAMTGSSDEVLNLLRSYKVL